MSLFPARTPESAFPWSLEEEKRQSFLSFFSQVLTWLPEERQMTRELIEYPFLKLEDQETCTEYAEVTLTDLQYTILSGTPFI